MKRYAIRREYREYYFVNNHFGGDIKLKKYSNLQNEHDNEYDAIAAFSSPEFSPRLDVQIRVFVEEYLLIDVETHNIIAESKVDEERLAAAIKTIPQMWKEMG